MNPLQKASARRKVFYLAAILALFTVSIFYRGLEAKTDDGQPAYVWLPFGRDDRDGGANQLAQATILSQARRSELRELERGDPELAGLTARQALTGVRGFAVAGLWYAAIDKQKRNDFHEFERLVKAVTSLQPHFVTPWIFQSWNIAYNVSVEMHGLGDMYFYIARGIELLAEGERRNRRSPDMRYQIGFYYQNKFGVADQVQTLRCLFQLSCIPPGERNPDDLLDPVTGEVDPKAFEGFCEKHPHLVRRLRGEERYDRTQDRSRAGGATLRTPTPRGVVDFLRANQGVPRRYRSAADLAEAGRQFPALPPRFNEGPDEAHPGKGWADLGDEFSGYGAARAWFTYANSLVPPNPRDEDGNPVPWGTPPPGTGYGEYDPRKYRLPRAPMLVIFEQAPARAQSYQATMEQKEGWFDAAGWDVDAAVDESAAWFTAPAPGGGRKKAGLVVGGGRPWSEQEWQKAARLWDAAGQEYALALSEPRLRNLRRQAGLPEEGGEPAGLPPTLTPAQLADPKAFLPWRATVALFFYGQNRGVTNFPYHQAQAEAEQQKRTIEARKVLWQADQARRAGNKLEAADLYKRGLGLWKEVLLRNPSFHRPDRSDRTEEETYEYEREYLTLIAEDDPEVGKRARAEFAAEVEKVGRLVPFVAAAPGVPEAARAEWQALVAERFFSPFADPIPATVGDARAGTPWVRDLVKETVLVRAGVYRRPPGGPPPGMSPPGQP